MKKRSQFQEDRNVVLRIAFSVLPAIGAPWCGVGWFAVNRINSSCSPNGCLGSRYRRLHYLGADLGRRGDVATDFVARRVGRAGGVARFYLHARLRDGFRFVGKRGHLLARRVARRGSARRRANGAMELGDRAERGTC